MKQQLQLLLLIGLVIALGVAGYRVLFESGPRHDLLVVSAREAYVEGNGDEANEALVAGMTVNVESIVRTGPRGNAALQYGEGANLTLMENASMKVLNADQSGVRVELKEGTLSARVRPGMPPLGINSRGRAITATDADFTVLVDQGGGLSAAVRQGSLSLQGFGSQTRLDPENILRSAPHSEPILQAATESLLLEVEWPAESDTRSTEMELRGRTDPYASVVFGTGSEAVRIRADRDGNFRATVPLAEGDNNLQLSVRDVLGRESTQERKVRRDSTAPVIESAGVVWEP